MDDLFTRSINVILANQHASGAYVACPSFTHYRYCWFRDGAFIAYAMDVVGQHESAERFHEWAAATILRHEAKAHGCIEATQGSQQLAEGDCLHTRYDCEGHEAGDEWPNFQLDGFGTWLWALGEHARRCGKQRLSSTGESAVRILVNYLCALWRNPCYDCWEEFRDKVHTSTLAAIYAGLRAAVLLVRDVQALRISAEIRALVLHEGIHERHLVKYMGTEAVDASLVGVSVPYRLMQPDDPLMQETVARIETDLHRPGGGVYRYAGDTYYGGGEWVLPAAWLGWYYAEVGETARARRLLRWVEAQADTDGYLPEQVSTHLLAPGRYAEWEARWGPVARPLLWSHAMYLILCHSLGGCELSNQVRPSCVR